MYNYNLSGKAEQRRIWSRYEVNFGKHHLSKSKGEIDWLFYLLGWLCRSFPGWWVEFPTVKRFVLEGWRLVGLGESLTIKWNKIQFENVIISIGLKSTSIWMIQNYHFLRFHHCSWGNVPFRQPSENGYGFPCSISCYEGQGTRLLRHPCRKCRQITQYTHPLDANEGN